MTLKEIENGIEERANLLRQMVGTLYPAILFAEIEELEERRCVIEQVLRNEGYV
jgi:hypothetical protein